MRVSRLVVLIVVLWVMIATAHTVSAAGDADRGAKQFAACAACHSLEPNRNMTGPSLAGIWGRKAGGLASFDRYSPALRNANLIWDGTTLDRWLTSPASLIPGNRMTFPGIADGNTRADLLAYLKAASSGEATAKPSANGMMGDGGRTNLRTIKPADQVKTIRYCRDSYHVITGDGEMYDFWENNLRFKTDSSAEGPSSHIPAILGAGMMGDRASIIFAGPEEISRFIQRDCQSKP